MRETVPRRIMELSSFVLAGGQSRRMGTPKPLLELGGQTLLERQVNLLRGVCRTVAVVGAPSGLADIAAPVYADELPGHGPLGGIYTGLAHSRAEYNLFLGCDLPFMPKRFLQFLARLACLERPDVTVPRTHDHHLQPLVAIYRRQAVGAIRAQLATGQNKASGFFRYVRCREVPWREIARAGFSPRIFDNINTAAEYAAAQRIVKSKG